MLIWDLLGEGRQPKRYGPGQMIYLQGMMPDCFYYLQQGEVRSFISLDSGEERVLTIHRSGDLMGEASFFDNCPRVSSAMAVEESLVYSVNQRQLDGIFLRHPELAQPMLQYLARTVRILSHHVGNASLPAQQRVARYLLDQPKDGQGLLHCTHEEIGQAVGVSRVTVSRILGQLSQKGILKTRYGSLSLSDSERFQKIAQGLP